ncbi:MAG: BON domain-containing protein [Burkholderiales bacterium]
MHIISAQGRSISLLALAAAGACALAVAGCGNKTPPAPAQAPATQAAAPAAPQAQPAPAPQLQAEPKPDPDKVLAAKVQDALRAKLGSLADGIDVTAGGGTVTLWGTVPETAKRHAAVRAASGVAGVKAVKDNMAIVAGS